MNTGVCSNVLPPLNKGILGRVLRTPFLVGRGHYCHYLINRESSRCLLL